MMNPHSTSYATIIVASYTYMHAYTTGTMYHLLLWLQRTLDSFHSVVVLVHITYFIQASKSCLSSLLQQ